MLIFNLVCASVVASPLVTGAMAAGDEPVAAPSAPEAERPPVPGQTRRVAGDREAKIREKEGQFFFDRMGITTPLPEGYPAPTPPGAIDLKTYPSVRRAEVTGSMNPSLGMNVGFFPLFNHIKRRNIAMTSPVEMDYKGWSVTAQETNGGPSEWTMSFLYRRADQGAAGVDEANEKVTIRDTEPVTVVAIGLRGGYGLGLVGNGLKKLEGWLAMNIEWEKAGEPRALYYNGPEKPDRDKWGEAQIPVRLRKKPEAPAGEKKAPEHQIQPTQPSDR
jgi:hypothetical protein